MAGEASQRVDFLKDMAKASAERLHAARARTDEGILQRRAEWQPPPAPLQLSEAGFDLVAEVKKCSPSAGRLAVDGDRVSPVAQAGAYAAAGAAAISVLTEPSRFAGSLTDLEQVASAVTDRPVMRKDFLVDPYQVVEARAAGAGGVLLIAAILEPVVLRDMLQTAFSLGMFALVEAFDETDLTRGIPVMSDLMPMQAGDGACRILLGINCRNLRTLEVEFTRFERMAKQLPATIPWVAESGVETPERAARVARAGYRLALVGTALMRSAEPADTARALIEAGRAARRS